MTQSIPIVRFQIEGLGDEIHAAIMAKGEDVADEVRRGVKAAADNLDIAGIAQRAAEDAIRSGVEKTVENYFKFGDGRKVIDELVGAAVAHRAS